MKLKPEDLTHTLKSNSFSTYWLAGDETLLIQESADEIRHHYHELGFTGRDIFNVERGFRWENFIKATANLSLFTEKKIFELRLLSSKLDEGGKQAILAYLNEPNPDFITLITSPKLETGVLNTKWFKSIETKIALLQIWPINKDGLASWLSKRLIGERIIADTDALELLSDRVEGNLLAAIQEIEKLKLLATQDEGKFINLDANTVMQVIADSSRYSTYNLVDAALIGDPSRCQKILTALKEEGIFPILIINAFARELRLLLPMIEKRALGQGVNPIMKAHHIWFSRKQAVANALNRLNENDIWRLLDKCRKVDQAIKGLSLANPWDELNLLALELSGQNTKSG